MLYTSTAGYAEGFHDGSIDHTGHRIMSRFSSSAWLATPVLASAALVTLAGLSGATVASPTEQDSPAQDPETVAAVTGVLLDDLHQSAAPGRTYDIGANPVLSRVVKAGLSSPRRTVVVQLVAEGGADNADPVKQAVRSLALEGLKSISGAVAPKNLLEAAAAQNKLSSELLRIIPKAAPPIKPSLKNVAGARTGAPDPSLPRFDWRNLLLVTRARDQETCGCCWAFGTLGAFEAAFAISNGGRLIHASEQHVLSCSHSGNCIAGWWAFDFVQGNGVAAAHDFEFKGRELECASNLQPRFRAVAWGYVSSSTTIPSVSEIKEALCRHGPLVSAVNNTLKFTAYEHGVFNERELGTRRDRVNHAVTIVGWDDTKVVPKDSKRTVWAVKNSWGEAWGKEGFMDIDSTSNNIGFGAAWVEAVNLDNPPDLIKLRAINTDAKPFPAVSFARQGFMRPATPNAPSFEERPAHPPAVERRP